MLFFPLWKRIIVWLVVACGVIIALPNFLPRSVLSYLPSGYASLHLPMGIDLQGGSRLLLGFDNKKNADEFREKTMDVMHRRLEIRSQNFPDFRLVKQGSSQIRVEVPGLFDVEFLKDIVTTPARLQIFAEDVSVSARDVMMNRRTLPEGDQLLYTMQDPPVGYLVKKSPVLDNADIARAFPEEKAGGDTASLMIALTPEGAKKFETATQDAAGKRLIVSFDGEVLSILQFPLEITPGFIRLGPFENDVAENLAAVFSAGPLPTDITLIEERTIGADLGSDYAKTGLYAAFGALAIVMLFMLICYGFLGIIADIALVINLVLLFGVLTLIGTPLSLSGFAGLVLIMGISVDANILIYERIREASSHGYSMAQSIQAGFTDALGTIVDADITTLIAALTLFLLGVGPIHGFALTVTVGIIISLFTTITLTRMMIVGWVKNFKPLQLPRGMVQLVPLNTHIGFMRIRAFTLSLSTILIFLVFGLYATMGVNYGIDFSGGSLAVLQTKKGDANLDDIRNRIWNINIGDASVEISKNPKEALVTIPSQDLGESAEQAVARKLDAEFADDYTLQRMDVVGPIVSQELSRTSILAVALSLLAIFLYVWLRFRWQFALGAVLTTIHDIIILIGIFIFFQWQFNIWSIAALLAIIGYSLNDTIVVYDRVRDLLHREGKITIAALVDIAINRTLSRTILTSLATLIAHIPLYYLGGPDMRNFASILLLGIVIGTYSSIFIAGPLLVLFGLKPSGALSAKTQSGRR